MEPWPTRREVAELGRRVDRLGKRMDTHERAHEQAERVREQSARERDRQRRTARRYWLTTIVTVGVTNAGTWVTIALSHHV